MAYDTTIILTDDGGDAPPVPHFIVEPAGTARVTAEAGGARIPAPVGDARVEQPLDPLAPAPEGWPCA